MAHRGTLRAVMATLVFALPTALAAPVAAETAERAADPPSRASAARLEEDEPRPQEEVVSFSPRRYYSTSRDARSYWSRDTGHPTGGLLWAGRHYFFCQVEGEPHTDGQGNYSTWWLLTDDDTGNRDVFVSATAVRHLDSWKPVGGLPRC